MSLLDFNAYMLEYFEEGTSSYDENGDYQEAAGEWIEWGMCNAVPAGRNNLIGLPNGDGRQVAFSFTINLHDPHAREFKHGERIRLTTIDGMETVELTVKGFARYQLQCKLYA